MDPRIDTRAFPALDSEEMAYLRTLAKVETYSDGQTVFRAGDADIDFFVVESGQLDVLNPTDNNQIIVSHFANNFVGDIDLLTRRPVIVTVVSRGDSTALRIPGHKLRSLLNMVPNLSDKLLVAFQVRREMLNRTGKLGLRVMGPGHCRETNEVREFLYKNFVPFVWTDTETKDGLATMLALNAGKKTPMVQAGDGRILSAPSLREIARCVGVWRECPDEEYDLAIIGAGPGGMAAAVYAASEGLRTVVLDRLGPGGQTGASSKIENFIGFPSGLSGTELATRAVLQMFKFGAQLVTPISVEQLIPAKTETDPHRLVLDCGTMVRAHVVLIATGVTWRRLDVPGSSRFERAGVYYACTSVESRAHDGTDVVVVGGGNSAGQAAMFLSESCAKKVHVLVRRDNLAESMSEYLAHRILSTPNIQVHFSTECTAVNGQRQIESIDTINRDTQDAARLVCSAVFVFIGAEPHATWLPTEIARDDLGYLLTGTEVALSGKWPLKDREPCPLETTIPRVLAGGDVRAGSTKRVGFAVGDGSYAVTCAHRLRTLRV